MFQLFCQRLQAVERFAHQLIAGCLRLPQQFLAELNPAYQALFTCSDQLLSRQVLLHDGLFELPRRIVPRLFSLFKFPQRVFEFPFPAFELPFPILELPFRVIAFPYRLIAFPFQRHQVALAFDSVLVPVPFQLTLGKHLQHLHCLANFRPFQRARQCVSVQFLTILQEVQPEVQRFT